MPAVHAYLVARFDKTGGRRVFADAKIYSESARNLTRRIHTTSYTDIARASGRDYHEAKQNLIRHLRANPPPGWRPAHSARSMS